MSEQTTPNTPTKPRGKKLNGRAAPLTVKTKPLLAPVAVSTIQISFPTPTTVQCPTPFQSLGTAASTTQMDQTATIFTPNGQIVGTLDANTPPPFTWSYTFMNALPQGVPLSIVVSGTTGTGARDQAVVPFQC